MTGTVKCKRDTGWFERKYNFESYIEMTKSKKKMARASAGQFQSNASIAPQHVQYKTMKETFKSQIKSAKN